MPTIHTTPVRATRTDATRGVVYRLEMPSMPVDRAEEMRLQIEQALGSLSYSVGLRVTVTARKIRASR